MSKFHTPFERKRHILVTGRQVQVEGLRVSYQEAGQGYPVVLVHGLSGSWRWWVRNIPALAQRYHLYLVDLPGFGSMRHARKHFALQQAADWLYHWMQAVGIERCHLIGHSMGGYISIRLAAAHPDLVSRLVLVSPAVNLQPGTVLDYLNPLAVTIKHVSARFLLILSYDALRAGPGMLLRTARALLSQEQLRDYNAIKAPTLLVWGENDTLVPLSLGYVLQGEISNARLLLLHHSGHVSMYECANEFNKEVITFLMEGEPGRDQ